MSSISCEAAQYPHQIMVDNSTSNVDPMNSVKKGKTVRIRRPKKAALSQYSDILEVQPNEKSDPTIAVEKEVLSHLGSYTEEPYHIVESYFEGQHLERLVRHQIESYNHFINYQIQRTIQMFNTVNIRSENDYVTEHDKYLLEADISFSNFKL